MNTAYQSCAAAKACQKACIRRVYRGRQEVSGRRFGTWASTDDVKALRREARDFKECVAGLNFGEPASQKV